MAENLGIDPDKLVIVGVFLLANIPVYWLVGSLFWDSLGDFFESLRFYVTPEMISAIRGEWHEDIWSELKLIFFIAICAIMVIGEYLLYLQISGQG